MAARRGIAAFTESQDVAYPAFVSVNREADGRIVLTARERGCGGAKIVVIEMTADELESFAFEVLGGVDRS